MPRNLVSMPTELLDAVVEHVDDGQICQLRLTCHSLLNLVHRKFRSMFNIRQTDLSIVSLKRLHDISSRPYLASSVRNLTITAVTYDHAFLSQLSVDEPVNPLPIQLTADERTQVIREKNALYYEHDVHYSCLNPNRTVAILQAVFYHLNALETLNLETAVYKMAGRRLPAYTCTDWPDAWYSAVFAYRITMLALSRSSTPLQTFNVYGGHWSGSLSMTDLTQSIAVLSTPELKSTFEGLKTLSLCTSAQNLADHDSNSPLQTIPGIDTTGTANFLKLCPHLEELDLHFYILHDGAINATNGILKDIIHRIQLPRLRCLKLRGTELRGDTLLRFLRRFSSIKEIHLHDIELIWATWQPIFEYCCDYSSNVEILTVRGLTESSMRRENDQVFFGDEAARSLLTFTGEEFKEGLKYRLVPDPWRWPEPDVRRSEYGPPLGKDVRTEGYWRQWWDMGNASACGRA